MIYKWKYPRGAIRSIRATGHLKGKWWDCGMWWLGKLRPGGGCDGCRQGTWTVFLGTNGGAIAAMSALPTGCVP